MTGSGNKQAHTEDGLHLLGRLAGFLPLLRAWEQPDEQGSVTTRGADVECLTLALTAARRGVDLEIAIPSGLAPLPVLAAVLLAADPVVDANSDLIAGPVVLVTRRAIRRQQIQGLRVAGVDFNALEPRRLRTDGYVSRLSGYGAEEVSLRNRLLVANPTGGLPEPVGVKQFSCVVTDAENSGAPEPELVDEWAKAYGAPSLLFSSLGTRSSGWTIDWPYIQSHGDSRPAGLGVGALGNGTVLAHMVADDRVGGLFQARAILGRLQRSTQANVTWPPILRCASRLARQLLTLPVPPGLYDGLIDDPLTVPLFERQSEISRATARKDLTPDFQLFGELEWTGLRDSLLEAMEAISEQNRKAIAIGQLVERAVSRAERIEVICESRIEARAMQAYLLRGGWAVPPTAFGDQVHVRAINDSRPWSDAPVRTFVAGIPSHKNRQRLLGGDLGPLEVVCYSNEAAFLERGLTNLVNDDADKAEERRRETIRSIVGSATTGRPVHRIEISVEQHDVLIPEALETGSGLLLSTRAEDAALADDLFGWIEGEDEEPSTYIPEMEVIARAFLCEPGSSVLLLEQHSQVDRVVDGHLIACEASAVAPGMLLAVFPTTDRRTLFRRLSPYLEELRGVGTRVWLWTWEDGLRDALGKSGSPRALADEIVERGGSITAEAVAEWPSPYRIGPQHPRHVQLVAEIAGHHVLELESARVVRVMRGVRQLHRQVGAAVAQCVKASLAGNERALDELERHLPDEAVEIVANAVQGMTVVKVVQDLGTGRTRSKWLRQCLSPATAREAFEAHE